MAARMGQGIVALQGDRECAEKAGHGVTAGWNFVRASLLAHAGQIFSRPGVAREGRATARAGRVLPARCSVSRDGTA